MKHSVAFRCLALFAFSVCARADVVNPNGLLEAATAADLEAAVETAGSDGLLLGHGMLKWTGTGETSWNGTFATDPVSNLEVTVNVENPDATLKIAGAASGSQYGVFIKSGPGTLEFAGGGTVGTAAGDYPWSRGWWVTYAGATSATFQPGTTAWNPDTGAAYGGGYSIFTVADGVLRFNAPGSSFNIPVQPWVGSRLQNSPRLEVTNNTSVTTGGGVFCIARGTGTSGNDAAPSVAVTDGGSLTVTQLSMGYQNGQTGFYPRSRLELDGGTFTVTGGPIEQPQNDGGKPVISAANGSLLYSTYRAATDYGWLMRGAAEAFVSSSSTVAVRQVANNNNTRIEVTGGGVLKYDRTVPKWYNQAAVDGANPARIYFDGSTLSRYSDVISEWFGNRGVGYTNFVVGANGMTVEADGLAWLGAAAQGGTVTKTGDGALFVRPSTNAAVHAASGTLGLTMSNPLRTNDTVMALSLASGSDLIVGGEGALGGSRVAVPAGSEVKFLGNAAPDNAEWKCNNYARRFFDGTIQMTLGDTDSWGSAWHSNLVSVAESFTVTFDSFTRCGANANMVEPYYGWMFVLQNKDLTRCGGNADNFGYGGGTAGTAMTDSGVASYAVGLNVRNCTFMTAQNGAKPAAASLATDVPVTKWDLAASCERPCRNTFSYDAANHVATLSVFIPSLGRTVTRSETVDLATLLGPNAYVGFTAATHSARNSEHCFRNFRVSTVSEKPGVLHTGGTLDVAATGSLDAVLGGNDAVGTFAVDAIRGSGAVTLNLSDAGMYPEETVVPLSSLDSSQWTFDGAGHMAADGPACSTGPKSNGGFISTNTYPVTGSWNLSCDWKSGLANNAAPADVLWFSFDNYGRPYNMWGSDGVTLRIVCYQAFGVRLYSHGTALGIGDGGSADANLYTNSNGESWFDLRYKGDLHIEMAHDADAQTLSVTLSQQKGTVSKTFTIANFDAAAVFDGKPRAAIRGYQTTGGAYAEAIFANLSMTGDKMDELLAARPARSAFAAAATEGVTSVTTEGDALLAFLEPGLWNVPVTVRGAGLRLSQTALEDACAGPGGGWVFNMPSGGYSPGRGVKIGSNISNNRDNAHYRHRVRVSGDWRASWTLENVNSRSADGISFFMHNDPRGPNAACVANAYGCDGFANRFAFAWHTYTHPTATNRWYISRNTSSFEVQGPVDPVVIRSGVPIDVTIEHDASAKTVRLTMTQNGATFSATVENAEIAEYVGGDYAWIGFGSTGGGYHTLPVFKNFKFEQLDEDADPFAAAAYLPSVSIDADADIVMDATRAGRTFRAAETLSVADGRRLRAFAADAAATLSAGTLSLGEGATLAGEGGATIAPGSLAGDLSTLAVDKAVLKISSADAASGKLATSAIVLSNGASLSVDSTCKAGSVTVDGVKLPAGVYSAANCSWISGSGVVSTARGTAIFIR